MDLRQAVKRLLDQVQLPPESDRPCGTDDRDLRDFEERTGLRLPEALDAWLRECNGALMGPGGLYGIRPPQTGLDIEMPLERHPGWLQRGWIPVPGDGVGNHYVVTTEISSEPEGIVLFLEEMENPHEPAYVVASRV
jgi:hypothetical protein